MAKKIREQGTQRVDRTLVWLMGITVFVLECVVGYYINVYVGNYEGDGISRVANAFYVLYSRNPHLGAIGFIWNPLPSMVDLVFLLLYPLIPVMATKGIAGLLMSALFASLTVSVLTRAFIQRCLPRWCAVIFPLLFSLNPMIFIYGLNGLSDAPFEFFVILSSISFLNWFDEHHMGDLVVTSLALGLAFWCRYEAITFGFSLFLGCVIATMLLYRKAIPPDQRQFRYRWSKMEGVLTVIASPIVYSVIVWVLLNWSIMKNPLYFLNGEYSNTALVQAQLSHSIYSDMVHNPLKASIFVIKMVLLFSAPLISILILRLINHRLVRWDTLILLGMFLSISMVQIIMLVTGTTFAWLRYFMYGLPVAVAWLPYELSKVKRQWHVIIPLIAMIANYGILSYVVTQPSMAPEENKFLQNSFGNQNEVDDDWKQQSEIARYLDDNYAHSSILVDTSSAFFIILQSKFPTQFYIPSDKEFINAVTDPEKYKVSYILLPNPKLVSGINVINMAYPNLYNQGADWVELVKEFGAKWKLYKVIQSTGRYALNTNNYGYEQPSDYWLVIGYTKLLNFKL